MIDDDDFLDDLDDFGEEAAPDSNSKLGALIVPGVCINSAVLTASGLHFKQGACPAIFESIDEVTGAAILDNVEDFRAIGYTGNETVDEVVQWLLDRPRNPEQAREIEAAIILARGDD
jgi:hypothetical protein